MSHCAYSLARGVPIGYERNADGKPAYRNRGARRITTLNP